MAPDTPTSTPPQQPQEVPKVVSDPQKEKFEATLMSIEKQLKDPTVVLQELESLGKRIEARLQETETLLQNQGKEHDEEKRRSVVELKGLLEKIKEKKANVTQTREEKDKPAPVASVVASNAQAEKDDIEKPGKFPGITKDVLGTLKWFGSWVVYGFRKSVRGLDHMIHGMTTTEKVVLGSVVGIAAVPLLGVAGQAGYSALSRLWEGTPGDLRSIQSSLQRANIKYEKGAGDPSLQLARLNSICGPGNSAAYDLIAKMMADQKITVSTLESFVSTAYNNRDAILKKVPQTKAATTTVAQSQPQVLPYAPPIPIAPPGYTLVPTGYQPQFQPSPPAQQPYRPTA